MKKILWFAGLYLLIGSAVLAWSRRQASAPIWSVPAGGDWQVIALWPLKLLSSAPAHLANVALIES